MACLFAVRDPVHSETLAERVTAARGFWATFRGLMGRRGLTDGEGLWLPGTKSIHMFFMRFPIDCVFLGPASEAGARSVVAVRHALAPWRGIVWYVRGAEGVLELAAGTLQRTGTAVGDRLLLEPAQAD
ncbi:DUF192 domain-containing protein [soil metagenome]